MPPFSTSFLRDLQPTFDGVAYLVASCAGGVLLWFLAVHQTGLNPALELLLPVLPFSVLATAILVGVFILPTWILVRQRVSSTVYACGITVWAISLAYYFGTSDNSSSSEWKHLGSVFLFGLYFGLLAYIYAHLAPLSVAPESAARGEA
jgi:hypothetical protein